MTEHKKSYGEVLDEMDHEAKYVTKHTYPSHYGRGKTWYLDAAWDILDIFKPGEISDDTRFLVAGMIAGYILKVAADPQAVIDTWKKQHGQTNKTPV